MKRITVLLILFATAIQAQKLPEIDGYKWNKCPSIKGAFLCPNDWHFKKSNANGQTAFFITKEKIKDVKTRFETGISIFVLKEIPKTKKMIPSKFMEAYIKSAKTKHKIFEEKDVQMGPFVGKNFKYEQKDKINNKDYKFFNLLISNDKTGTLYLVIFESPKKEWAKEYSKADKVLKMLYIDDTI